MQDLNPKAQVVVLLVVTTMKIVTRMRKTITITITTKDLVQVMVQKRKRKRNSIANPMCQISIDLKRLEKKVNISVANFPSWVVDTVLYSVKISRLFWHSLFT